MCSEKTLNCMVQYVSFRQSSRLQVVALITMFALSIISCSSHKEVLQSSAKVAISNLQPPRVTTQSARWNLPSLALDNLTLSPEGVSFIDTTSKVGVTIRKVSEDTISIAPFAFVPEPWQIGSVEVAADASVTGPAKERHYLDTFLAMLLLAAIFLMVLPRDR